MINGNDFGIFLQDKPLRYIMSDKKVSCMDHSINPKSCDHFQWQDGVHS